MTRHDMKPFGSREKANAAIDAFYAEVEAARAKWGIQNVVVAAKADFHVTGDGIHDGLSHMILGDQFHALPMVATLYGRLRVTDQEMLARRIAPPELTMAGRVRG
jgi:hypothetical protein